MLVRAASIAVATRADSLSMWVHLRFDIVLAGGPIKRDAEFLLRLSDLFDDLSVASPLFVGLFCSPRVFGSFAFDLEFEFFQSHLVSFAKSVIFDFGFFERQFVLKFLQLDFAWRDRPALASGELLHQFDAIVLCFLCLERLNFAFGKFRLP